MQCLKAFFNNRLAKSWGESINRKRMAAKKVKKANGTTKALAYRTSQRGKSEQALPKRDRPAQLNARIPRVSCWPLIDCYLFVIVLQRFPILHDVKGITIEDANGQVLWLDKA